MRTVQLKLKEVWQKHSGKAMRTNSSNKALLAASRKIYCCSSLFNRRRETTALSRSRSPSYGEDFAVRMPGRSACGNPPQNRCSLEDLSGRVEACFPPTRRGSVRSPIVQEFWLKYSRYKDGTM
jgi:hypothetical protein